MAKVLIAFRDRDTWRLWRVGEDWDGTPERLKKLSEAGYVQGGPITHDGEENGSETAFTDSGAILDGMTVAELREMCETRGIDAPKRATKARLIELLGD